MGFLKKLLGGGGGTKQPKIAKDSLASLSTAKILYGLAEGEISGLVDGAKSIKLDDTPLLNDAGKPNFVDEKNQLAVVWDFRSGTNNQEYIKGFPDVSNEINVNVQVKKAIPYVRQITNLNLSAVVVRVSFGALREQKKNGDITGTRVDYKIELATDGGVYQTIIDTNVSAKTSDKYQRSHRIDLPKAQKNWLIRVTRLTDDSTSDLLSNAMHIEAITEVIDVKLSYPNTAMLGLQYDARTFSSIANLAVRCRGKIIRVPSNYNAETRTYTGIWNGTFISAYSNNPAWVFYDLCLNWRYGLGARLDAGMIDKWALYAIGRYCDELVDDGKGGREPRFTVNVYLQSQQDAFSVLQSLASIFRAMTYWNGEQVSVAMDAPSEPVYTFSCANVINGEFSYTGTRARDRHTVAKVAWDNPQNAFKTEYEFVRDEAAIAKYGINTLDIGLMGCTSQGQAQRAGLWALKSEQLESRQVSFAVGLDGMLEQIKPSAIIAISDEVFAGRANGGRVVAISSDKRTITLDREVTAGETLVINNANGQAERRKITNISGSQVTVDTAFGTPEVQNVWAIDSSDLRLMLFKIISIKQNDDLTHTINAVQHEPQKYDAVDKGAYVKPQVYSVVEPDLLNAPTNVIITQSQKEAQGQIVVTMTISWGQVEGAAYYLVEFKKDDGSWVNAGTITGLSLDIEGVYAGIYLARVRAVNAFGDESPASLSAATQIVGKIGTPPKLASLTATGKLFAMQLDWVFAQGSGDTNYTEVQVASAPNTNVALLATYAYPTNTAVINGLQGGLVQYYRGRIVDKFGQASEWTDWAEGVVDDDAAKVLDLLNGQITESQLYKDLGEKIDKIEPLGDDLAKEIQERSKAINETTKKLDDAVREQNNAIAQEVENRQIAVGSVSQQLGAEVQNRINALNEVSATVQSEINTRTEQDYLLAQRIDSVIATTDNNTALAQSQINAQADKLSALTGRVDVVAATSDSNTSLIKSEQIARANADEALSQRVDSVFSQVGNNTALIQTQSKTLSDAINTQASRIDGVYAQVNPDMAGSGDLAGNDKKFAGVWSETSARIEGDTALGQRIDQLTAEVGNSLASVRSKTDVTADSVSALASQVNTLSAAVGGNISLVMDNYYTKTMTDSTIASRLEALKSEFVIPELNAKASASAVNDVKTQISYIADKLNIASSKLDGVYAQLNPQMAGDNSELAGNEQISAGVWSEASARIEGDTALGQRIDALNVSVNGNIADIATTNRVLIDADKALAERIDSLTSNYHGNIASIQNQLKSLSDANSSQASSIQTLTASYHTAQSTANDARARADNAQNAANNADAAIRSEAQTRASADSALSQRIDTVQSTVGNHTASIQTQQQTINGLNAQYTVRIDNNGRVSGFGLASSPTVSDFAVRADKFYIAPPNGYDKGQAPFVVLSTGQWIDGTYVPAGTYIDRAYIANGSITNAQIKDAAITNAKISDAAITSAKIGYAEVDTLNIRGQAVSISTAIVQNNEFRATPTGETGRLYLRTDGVSTSVEFSLIGCNPNGSGGFTVECFVDGSLQGSWYTGGPLAYHASMLFPFLVSTGTGFTEIYIRINCSGIRVNANGYFLKATALKR
ncbi:TipJ family phage tail tip protein [Helicobacter pylori]|uniref:TipJ family phage tail tip protein n=1 Tax=Helicobacter pylori TaxID=210 RepID=UPI002AC78E5B|nr:phage tail protein [Helicobacter pylori]MDZ5288555.1 phage tail protein [Helicobacter pylori]